MTNERSRISDELRARLCAIIVERASCGCHTADGVVVQCERCQLLQALNSPAEPSARHELYNGETVWNFHQQCGCGRCRQVYNDIARAQEAQAPVSLSNALNRRGE